jgi:hypothetical protein
VQGLAIVMIGLRLRNHGADAFGVKREFGAWVCSVVIGLADCEPCLLGVLRSHPLGVPCVSAFVACSLPGDLLCLLAPCFHADFRASSSDPVCFSTLIFVPCCVAQ